MQVKPVFSSSSSSTPQNLHFIDIFGNFWATLFGYLFGVLLVITLGMQVLALLERIVTSSHEKHHAPHLEEHSQEASKDTAVVEEERAAQLDEGITYGQEEISK